MKMQRTAGVNFKIITIDGKKYTLRPYKVGMYAQMEAYVVSLLDDPMEIATRACKAAPTEQHAAIWDAAMRSAKLSQIVTAQEMKQFENSIRGIAWKLWACIKEDHPEVDTVDKAIELIEAAGNDALAEIAAKINVASGEADMGNSSGPAESEAVTEATTMPGQGGQ